MKRVICNVALMVSLTCFNPLMVYAKTSASNSQNFSNLFFNYKQDIVEKGLDKNIASEKFLKAVLDSNISVEEIKIYAKTNMSEKNYQKFTQALEKGLYNISGTQLSAKKVASVLENIILNEKREEAQWVSCGTGLGVGIPLLVAGVVTGIVALSLKRTQESEITKKWIDARNELLVGYNARENTRQLDILNYQTNIKTYQQYIDELQDKIDSGNYGRIEIENMKQAITDYKVDIINTEAAIVSLQNYQAQNLKQYNDALAYFNTLEENEIKSLGDENDKVKRSQKVLGITTALTIPMGLYLVIDGSKNCN